MWKVLGIALPILGSSKSFAIGLSIVIAMLIYWQSAPVIGAIREKVTGFVFALINSFAIAAAVLGINSITT